MKNSRPVLNADATVQVMMPTQDKNISAHSIFPLHDNGLGYPDITSGDGIYSAYLPMFGDLPGYYSVRMVVTAKEGQASIPVVPHARSGMYEYLSFSNDINAYFTRNTFYLGRLLWK